MHHRAHRRARRYPPRRPAPNPAGRETPCCFRQVVKAEFRKRLPPAGVVVVEVAADPDALTFDEPPPQEARARAAMTAVMGTRYLCTAGSSPQKSLSERVFARCRYPVNEAENLALLTQRSQGAAPLQSDSPVQVVQPPRHAMQQRIAKRGNLVQRLHKAAHGNDTNESGPTAVIVASTDTGSNRDNSPKSSPRPEHANLRTSHV